MLNCVMYTTPGWFFFFGTFCWQSQFFILIFTNRLHAVQSLHIEIIFTFLFVSHKINEIFKVESMVRECILNISRFANDTTMKIRSMRNLSEIVFFIGVKNIGFFGRIANSYMQLHMWENWSIGSWS